MSECRNFWTLKDDIELILDIKQLFQSQKRLPKWRQHFAKIVTQFLSKKPQNFVWFGPACGPNTYQIMYGETLDFQCQCISNGNIKYPIEKSNFPVTLPLKLFRATVANADIGSLKSLHTFLKNVCTTC